MKKSPAKKPSFLMTKFGMKKHPDKESAMEDMMDTMPESKEKKANPFAKKKKKAAPPRSRERDDAEFM